jgi:hypothetical protein
LGLNQPIWPTSLSPPRGPTVIPARALGLSYTWGPAASRRPLDLSALLSSPRSLARGVRMSGASSSPGSIASGHGQERGDPTAEVLGRVDPIAANPAASEDFFPRESDSADQIGCGRDLRARPISADRAQQPRSSRTPLRVVCALLRL